MQLHRRCPKCRSTDTFRVGYLSLWEALLTLLLIRRYGCRSCNWPFRDFALNLRVAPGRPRH